MAIGLIIVGVVIAFGSFVFAAINMGKQAKNFLGGDVDKTFSGIGGMFGRHIGAMIGMVFGGLILTAGLIIGAVQLVQSLVP